MGVVTLTPAAFGNQSKSQGIAHRLGIEVVMDFYTWAIASGMGYQVRAGTITTPLSGDIEITDAAAEMCADVAANFALMPVYLNIDIEALVGTLPHVTAKSVGTVSSAGTAFTPLPLRSDGGASNATARVQAAGAVTVTAELATTTLRHYAMTIAAVGNYIADHEFRPAPLLVGARCFYVQIGSVTTGSTYFGHFDFIEGRTDQLT